MGAERSTKGPLGWGCPSPELRVSAGISPVPRRKALIRTTSPLPLGHRLPSCAVPFAVFQSVSASPSFYLFFAPFPPPAPRIPTVRSSPFIAVSLRSISLSRT